MKSIQDSLRGVAAGIFIERPARDKSLHDWVFELELSAEGIVLRAVDAKDQVAAAKVLRHITGIERWCQSRLEVFLGGTFVRDEYDGYQPGADLSPEQQRLTFQETREETIKLAQELALAGIPDTVTVVHNSFGPLTVRGWLRYTEMHASLESQKLR